MYFVLEFQNPEDLAYFLSPVADHFWVHRYIVSSDEISLVLPESFHELLYGEFGEHNRRSLFTRKGRSIEYKFYPLIDVSIE